jgi:hypothetical protein
MSDDLDALERRVEAGRRQMLRDGYHAPEYANAAITIAEAVALIERCRKAEAEIEEYKAVEETQLKSIDALVARQSELESQLARWPAAVAKVREAVENARAIACGCGWQILRCPDCRNDIKGIAMPTCFDEITRLATEATERKENAHEPSD